MTLYQCVDDVIQFFSRITFTMAFLVAVFDAVFNGVIGFPNNVQLVLVAPPIISASAKTLHNVKQDMFSECV